MTNCKGLLGRLLGHDYRPVFNVFPPEIERLDGIKGSAAGVRALFDGLSRKEHVRTVCKRCGNTLGTK